MTDWTSVDLTSLGSHVHSLEFTLTSSDNSTYGEETYMNTPAYFCFDSVAFFQPGE
jgi:hypothetical protein